MFKKHRLIHTIEMTQTIKSIYEVGYGIPLLCLIQEKSGADSELGLNEAHKTLMHLCPSFNSFRSYVLRLVKIGIIELKISQFKKNKKTLQKGPAFVEEIFMKIKLLQLFLFCNNSL